MEKGYRASTFFDPVRFAGEGVLLCVDALLGVGFTPKGSRNQDQNDVIMKSIKKYNLSDIHSIGRELPQNVKFL
ncbi:MAG: hypothetical protein H6573_28685 [Lewinellaceae bacterium]|nr:hypothetical protein [Lewinellaceae bacterium]